MAVTTNTGPIYRRKDPGIFGRLVGARSPIQANQAKWGYIFLLPWLLGLIIFWIGPILISAYFSVSPQDAGRLLVKLSREYDFAFHSHWMTDYVGHRGPFERAVELLEILDGVIEGILDNWRDDEGLVLLTSDHGNMEHIGDRKHTANDVPTIIIGKDKADFAEGFTYLTDFVPRMERYLFGT